MVFRPGTPLHELAGVSDGVDDDEKRVPETSAGEHTHKVQIPVLTDVIDHCIRTHPDTQQAQVTLEDKAKEYHEECWCGDHLPHLALKLIGGYTTQVCDGQCDV